MSITLPKEYSTSSRLSKTYHRKLLIKLSESQNHRCCYCGCVCIIPSYKKRLQTKGKWKGFYYTEHRRQLSNDATIEHIIPVVFQTDIEYFDYYNCAMACAKCNSTRSGYVDWEIAKLTYELFGRRYLGKFTEGFDYLIYRNKIHHQTI